MKFSLFFLLIALHVSATNYGQNQINLSEKNVSLSDVFQKIEKQTNYRFYYSNDVLPGYKLVSINVINATLHDVMPKLLEGTNIMWDVTPKNKVIIAENDISNSKFLTFGKIAGLVVDEKGDFIQGASVSVVGQSKGVSTNSNGEFVIEAGIESVLEITAVGYKTKRIAVKDIPQGVFRIQLEQDLQNLDQVVVVGYGKIQRKNLTSALSSIKASDVIKSTDASLNSALQGRASGVSVVSSEGGPGANVSIIIRGGSSISAKNDPLYVINGFPQLGGNNLNINVNDIETIDILKDGSAAAYGSRGANGVILITTKSAKAGKFVVNYDGYVTQEQLSRRLKVMTTPEYAQMQHFLNFGEYGDTTIFKNWQNFKDSASINWMDRVLREPMGQSHTLSMSGGTENLRALVSFGYFNNPGILANTQFNRYTANVNISAKLNKLLSNETVLYFTQSQRNGPSASGDGGIIYSTVRAAPYIGSNNHRLSTFMEKNLGFGGFYGVDPEAELFDPKIGTKGFEGNLNTAFTFRITSNLNLRVSGGLSKGNSEYKGFYPRSTSSGRNSDGTSGINNDNTFSWLSENTLNYTNTFKDIHAVEGVLGMSAQKNTNDGYGLGASHFPFETLGYDFIGGASFFDKPYSYKNESQLMSYFGIVRYTLNNRYLFSAMMRADGSSKFPKHRWGYFPFVSAGWKINEESFMKSVTSISTLKLSASYGQSGNESVSPYASMSTYEPVRANSDQNGGYTNALAPIKLGVGDLKWETNIQTNLRFDLGLFNDRILFTANAFKKQSKDLLLGASIPYASGYKTVLKNVGDISVKGLEFELGTKNVVGSHFSWNTNFNISFTKGKVNSLADGEDYYIISTDNEKDAFAVKVGEQLGSMWGYVYNGLVNTHEEYYNGPEYEGLDVFPGTRGFKDINGDGVVNNDDRTIIGNGNPKYFGGINNDFKYSNFDFSFLFTFTYGNDILNWHRYLYRIPYAWQGGLQEMYNNHWTNQNPQTNAKAWTSAADNEYNTLTSYQLEDGSYLRLKNVMLGYSLPTSIIKKAGISRLRFYASAQNLLTFTKYSGFDPEVNYFNNMIQPGVDLGAYPRNRTLTFGVNVTF